VHRLDLQIGQDHSMDGKGMIPHFYRAGSQDCRLRPCLTSTASPRRARSHRCAQLTKLLTLFSHVFCPFRRFYTLHFNTATSLATACRFDLPQGGGGRRDMGRERMHGRPDTMDTPFLRCFASPTPVSYVIFLFASCRYFDSQVNSGFLADGAERRSLVWLPHKGRA
jgi:hypothetical protein